MIEVVGNLWTYEPEGGYVDARVILTNGYVKKNGEAVMGKGCAKEAAALYPDVPAKLGHLIKQYGNHVHLLTQDWMYYDGVAHLLWDVVSFPTKHNWQESSTYSLVKRSAVELSHLANERKWKNVVLPRPGCGNGGLTWKYVKPVIEKHLDDRFKVITYG